MTSRFRGRTKAPISVGAPTSDTNHTFEPGPSGTVNDQPVQVIYVPQRQEITEEDLRIHALDKAVVSCASVRHDPSEVLPMANEYLAFLKEGLSNG